MQQQTFNHCKVDLNFPYEKYEKNISKDYNFPPLDIFEVNNADPDFLQFLKYSRRNNSEIEMPVQESINLLCDPFIGVSKEEMSKNIISKMDEDVLQLFSEVIKVRIEKKLTLKTIQTSAPQIFSIRNHTFTIKFIFISGSFRFNQCFRRTKYLPDIDNKSLE